MIKVNHAGAIAAILLGGMLIIMGLSVRNDAAITDEIAHIPAGYSYMALKDMRLNPEHPPLIKDLAGLPLLFLDLNFPTTAKAWTEDLNGQWDMGRIFLYHAGNDADQVLWWARVPMMLLAIMFGWILFHWTRRHFGNVTALLTLFLFAFSPTFIAHARYVTTDLAASFGFLIGLITFVNFLERPSRKNLAVAGLALGIAQLLKFSVVLLVPTYGVVALIWVMAHHKGSFMDSARRGMRLVGHLAAMGGIAAVVIMLVYQWHVWNYPADRQLADAAEILSSFGKRWLVDIDLWLIQHDATRALGQYMLGVLMVVQRAAGGNTAYFLGEVANEGWWYYFPLLYLLKETVTLHMFTLFAAGSALARVFWNRQSPLGIYVLARWFRNHIAETAMLAFITIYWWYSIDSPLNIGVRHVLPTFPFIYILVSRQIAMRLGAPKQHGWRYAGAGVFLVLAGFSVLRAFPYYLSYFNILAGNPAEAYTIVVDSNFDWGQDLRRLRDYTDEHNIEHIAVDYFGGGEVSYYFGDKAEGWWSSRGMPEGYFAISASFRQGAFGTWIETPYHIKPPEEDRYPWLRGKKPVARAGTSIFIYNFGETGR